MIKKMVIKAYNFSENIHEGTLRKFSELPYFTHVKFVARVLDRLGCNETMVAAAFLHDSVEDTDTTYEDLVEEFGREVADLVLEVTSDEKDMIAAGGKRMYLANKVCNISSDALTIKLADRFHNVLFLEHDSTPKEFIIRYFKETRFIFFTLEESGRELNEHQEALVRRTNAILEFLRIRYAL